MNAPKDPFLRAIWLVSNLEDVTDAEGMALLALWRFFGGEKKYIGPTLLGFLLSANRENSKSIMRHLTEKGYLGSDGSRGCGVGSGRCALRWLTRKANLPNITKRGQAKIHEAGSGDTPLSKSKAGYRETKKRGMGLPTDLGVRQGDPLVSLSPSAGAQGAPEERNKERCGGAPKPDGEAWDHIPDGEGVLIVDIMCGRSNP